MTNATEPDVEFLKRGIYYAFETIASESLGGISIEDTEIWIDEETTKELVNSEEIQLHNLGARYQPLGMCWPEGIYGFKIKPIRHRALIVGEKNRTAAARIMLMVGTMRNYPITFTCEIPLP